EHRQPEVRSRRWPVLTDEGRLAVQEQLDLVRPRPGRDADLVGDDGLGRNDGAEALLSGANGKVRVLPVHEEALVEAAERLPNGSRNKEEAARDDADLPHRVALPASQ